MLSTISTRLTPQGRKADSRQVRNNAGGHVFEITDTERLRRFLVLGAEGTYYASAGDLAVKNAEVVLRMAEQDHAGLRAAILDVSLRGAAPKQNPALFALAIACSHGTDADKSAALELLPQVARTGTHLFIFARYVQQFRGWGRGLRRAVGGWYASKDADSVAFQAVKYRQREGWSHRDLLRKAHPVTADPGLRATFDWITHGSTGDATPRMIEGFLKAQAKPHKAAKLVGKYGLSWEMLPDEALADAAAWEALLDKGMPQTALMRQLPRLTRLGLLPSMGGRTAEVARQLTDPERLRKARVHPVNVLVAQRTYAAGRSARGTGSWTPTRKIVDALDEAFYAAFGAVEPAGKRTMLALDVSGSMTAPIASMPLTCREASAALALVQMATEPETEIVGFTSGRRLDGLTPLPISPRQRLDDAIASVSNLPFGGTDCALPMLHALKTGLAVETFVVLTDSETWCGDVHPHQALRFYREKMGIASKLIVVGMTSTGFSIANPDDALSLDIAGFDIAVPNLISEFSRGL